MQRSARVAGAALVTGLVLGACTYTPSKLGADAEITLDGPVLRQDGRPAAGARVSLDKHNDAGEALGAVLSVGLACLTDEYGDICRSARVTTSNGRGNYTFHIKGRDTHGSIGNASTMELSAALPRRENEYEGPGTSMTFLVQKTHMVLPLRAWEPAVSATAERRVIRVTWTDPPPRLIPEVDPSRLSSRVRFERRGQLVWQFDDLDSGAEIDPRLLEDTTGSFAVALEGGGFEVPEEKGTEIGVTLRSARLAYRSHAGKPVSRGAACSVIAGGRSHAQPSCSLTDGNFGAKLDPQTTSCPTNGCPPTEGAIIDLGRVVPVSLVAVRGCSSPCAAAVSTDARSWSSIGRSSPDETTDRLDHAFTLSRGIRARYVRVSTRGIRDLREVSVWDRAAPLAPAPASFVAPVAKEDLPRPAPTTDSASRWVLVASILGGIALGALGMALLRRRRTA